MRPAVRLVPTLAAAALVAIGTAALAQPAPGPNGAGPGDHAGGPPRPRLTRADIDSLVDARIAAIQAGLKLTPDQQKLWPPAEQAIRAIGADLASRWEARRQGGAVPAGDFMARLDRRAERATAWAQHLTALDTALKPLWASFDERQKRLLPILMRPPRATMAIAGTTWRERMAARMGGMGMGGMGMGMGMGTGMHRGMPGMDGQPDSR